MTAAHDPRHGTRPIPVSVIVMTKNEEANVERCLRALDLFDEVFVVDSGSADRTVEIAEKLGATVVPFRWDGGYPKKKQWCLDRLPFRNEWVLYVDADEVVPRVLADEIAATLPSSDHSGFFVAYDYVFLGKLLRHGRRVQKLVLLKHRLAAFAQLDDLESQNMWEVEGHYQPAVQGSVARLSSRMIHEDHDSLFHYFERHNRYSEWEAVVRSKRSLQTTDESSVGLRNLLKQVFSRMPLKGVVAFLNCYVLRAGFLDGRAGLHYALSLGFYYWQIAVKELELAQGGGNATRTKRRDS